MPQLRHSAGHVLRRLLIQLGLGSDMGTDWPVFVTVEPDMPDNVITIYNTQGELLGSLQPTGEVVEHYGCLVRVRSGGYDPGWTKADEIRYTLDELVRITPVSVNGNSYEVVAVNRSSGVLELGPDPANGKRDLFTLNYTLPLRRIS
jgi:hypothetical protein